MKRLRLIAGPTEEPVTLAEAKAAAAIDSALTAFDAMLTRRIAAVRRRLETEVRRVFVTQTWELTLDGFPPFDEITAYPAFLSGLPGFAPISLERSLQSRFPIKVPTPPLASVTSVTYLDPGGTLQTLSPTAYQAVLGTPGEIWPAWSTAWPNFRPMPETVVVRYVAGYGAASAVPDTIKTAIELWVAHLFQNREATTNENLTELPRGVADLLAAEDWGYYG